MKESRSKVVRCGWGASQIWMSHVIHFRARRTCGKKLLATLRHTLCNTLRRCRVNTATYCDTLQHMATHCITLQRTATHYSTLQHTATHCSTLHHARFFLVWVAGNNAARCNTLQHTATHCNTLQHTATHCNTLQHTATHCKDTLKPIYICDAPHSYTATHCNTLQHTATHDYFTTWLIHTCAIHIWDAPHSYTTVLLYYMIWLIFKELELFFVE